MQKKSIDIIYMGPEPMPSGPFYHEQDSRLTQFFNWYNYFYTTKEGREWISKWMKGKWINEPYQKSKHLFNLDKAKQELLAKGGMKSEISGNKTLGIPNYILVIGGLLIVSAIGYKIYKNRK
jgi:hypothetical protein